MNNRILEHSVLRKVSMREKERKEKEGTSEGRGERRSFELQGKALTMHTIITGPCSWLPCLSGLLPDLATNRVSRMISQSYPKVVGCLLLATRDLKPP